MVAPADDAMLILLDCRLAFGFVTLDAQGRVLSRNDVASALFDEGDGVTVHRGRLATSPPDAGPQLAGLLATACKGGGRSGSGGGTLEVARRSPRPPITLIAVPLGRPARTVQDRVPAALVLLSDPERTPPRPERVLARRYGLTPSEAEVAVLVLRGARIEDVARARHTSLHTARTQMKRLLGKVGVQSQLDLVRALLTGPHFETPAEAIDVPLEASPDAVLRIARPATAVAR